MAICLEFALKARKGERARHVQSTQRCWAGQEHWGGVRSAEAAGEAGPECEGDGHTVQHASPRSLWDTQICWWVKEGN